MSEAKYALLSVYDKTGIQEFAHDLLDLEFQLLSSGGTAKVLEEAGLPVTDVAKLTGMPAILSHRVVTLHPMIHGGLLAERSPEHDVERKQHGIPWIELVCVDLYPLEQAINEAQSNDDVIKMIDIGGPTMIMAGAKGNRIVICDPADREPTIEWLRDMVGGSCDPDFDQRLRAKAFKTIAEYRRLSSDYFNPET